VLGLQPGKALQFGVHVGLLNDQGVAGGLGQGGAINVQGNQGDLLTNLLSCASVPLDRPIGIATKQITEMRA